MTKAKADIEAMVLSYAAQHGVALDPATTALQLAAGEPDDTEGTHANDD